MKRRYIFGNSLSLVKNHHLSFGTIRKTLKDALVGAKENILIIISVMAL